MALDRVELGLGTEQDPRRLGSRSKSQKAVERLDAAHRRNIRAVLLPELHADFAGQLSVARTLGLDPRPREVRVAPLTDFHTLPILPPYPPRVR